MKLAQRPRDRPSWRPPQRYLRKGSCPAPADPDQGLCTTPPAALHTQKNAITKRYCIQVKCSKVLIVVYSGAGGRLRQLTTVSVGHSQGYDGFSHSPFTSKMRPRINSKRLTHASVGTFHAERVPSITVPTRLEIRKHQRHSRLC